MVKRLTVIYVKKLNILKTGRKIVTSTIFTDIFFFRDFDHSILPSIYN